LHSGAFLSKKIVICIASQQAVTMVFRGISSRKSELTALWHVSGTCSVLKMNKI